MIDVNCRVRIRANNRTAGGLRRAALAVAAAAAVGLLAAGCSSDAAKSLTSGSGGSSSTSGSGGGLLGGVGGGGGSTDTAVAEATGIVTPTDPAGSWDLAGGCAMVKAVWTAFATNYAHQLPDPSGAFYGLNNDLSNYGGYLTSADGPIDLDVDALSQAAESMYSEYLGGDIPTGVSPDFTRAVAAVAKDCNTTLPLS